VAKQQVDVLALGRGNLNSSTDASTVFSANNVVTTWSSSTTYAQYNVVEYAGNAYRSKIASNLNNEPDTSPNDWETLYVGVKDGDVCVVIAGSGSTILQRKSTVWSALVAAPIVVPLVDGQASPATAIQFLGNSLTYAKVTYTLVRGTYPSAGRMRAGTFNVLNDGVVSNVSYDHEFTDIGADVEAYMSWTYSGTNVELQYTSTSLGVPLYFEYSISGWS